MAQPRRGNSGNHGEGLSASEKYLFDLWGYIKIEGVLSAAEVHACNAAIDRHELRRIYRGSDGKLADNDGGGANKLQGSVGGGMLGWGGADGDLFRRLNCHPTVCKYLNALLGYGFRMDHAPSLRVYPPADPEDTPAPVSGRGSVTGLHGSSGPGWDPHQHYVVREGQIHNGLTVVAWQFKDIGPGDGGFGLIPGSHKSNFALPPDMSISPCATRGKSSSSPRHLLY